MRTGRRSEAEVQAAILKYLDTRGDVVAWRANSRVVVMPGQDGRMRPVRFGFKGQPDIIGWVRRAAWRGERNRALEPVVVPVFLAIEVKAKGQEGTVTVEQRAFLDKVRADGGLAVVASSVAHVAEALDTGGA